MTLTLVIKALSEKTTKDCLLFVCYKLFCYRRYYAFDFNF